MTIHDVLDLERYPLHEPGSPQWQALVERCRADLLTKGMYNLDDLVRSDALDRVIGEIRPVFDTLCFTQDRSHNMYFKKEIPGIAADHPAMREGRTASRKISYDQFPQSLVASDLRMAEPDRLHRGDHGEGRALYDA